MGQPNVAMDIEVVSKKASMLRRRTPLLFVHGAYASARLWEPFFLPFFADAGYAACALSLRGHGNSATGPDHGKTRLRDYVDDVIRVAEGLDRPPVLIGHSMGGLIIQKAIERYDPAGVILIASAPPHGILPTVFSAALFNPIMSFHMSRMQLGGPEFATVDGAKRALFREDTPEDYIRSILPPAYGEPNGVMLDMLGLDLPSFMNRRDLPVLVLGGEKDACISTVAVEATARAFGVKAEIFPGMPHALMLDPEWRQVAERMLAWLDATLEGDEGGAATSHPASGK